MNDAKRTRLVGSTVAAIMIMVWAPVAIAGGERQRAVRPPPELVVGTEYRIAAKPDSPWLESVDRDSALYLANYLNLRSSRMGCQLFAIAKRR